jgi:hypothetical protein
MIGVVARRHPIGPLETSQAGGRVRLAIALSPMPSSGSPQYSQEFVTKLPRRQARRARGAAREAYLKQYVDRPSGEPARRQACRSGVSVVVVEVFVNNAGTDKQGMGA